MHSAMRVKSIGSRAEVAMVWIWAVLVTVTTGLGQVTGAHWTHSVDLDPNYTVFWTPGAEDITFEVQVRTLGYIGFGFSADGQMPGADIVTAWVRDNQVLFQDRHATDRLEPEVDQSQDYEMLLGYENGTHTVFRFRRKYDTCDQHDYRITNGTTRLIYSYNDVEPTSPYREGPLAYHGQSRRGTHSLHLIERSKFEDAPSEDTVTWDLRNPEVSISANDYTFHWCKIFKLPHIRWKHHIVRYEPLLQYDNSAYISNIIVYECQGSEAEFGVHARDRGQLCYQPSTPSLLFTSCSSVIIAWALGSKGFSFPPEAGYPLDPDVGPRYFLMETHYNNPIQDADITDSSGIRLYYTASLRRQDAGVLSVGLDPNWRHIIPPGQPEVVSEGHCISACTEQALPSRGIKVFAVVLHTHIIGRKVRLRHIRRGNEFAPISEDNNYNYSCQEYRRLQKPVTVHPGDHLIAQCVYNSEGRSTITLGGLTTREEMCLVFALFYPRIDMSQCHSLPSLPTVLHSLGIQELWPGSSPVRIKSPPDLADMTLENRLVTYDWENQFKSFQDATRKGSFKPLCRMKTSAVLLDTEHLVVSPPNITKPYREVSECHNRWQKPPPRKKPGDGDDPASSDWNVLDKVYKTITVHDSSRLNTAVWTTPCSLVVISYMITII